MNWKPNRWLAIFAGLIFWPIGLLYVGRWPMPVLYFVAFVAAGLTELVAGTPMYSPAVILIGSLVHAFWLATKATPGTRPWYSRWYGMVGVFLGLLAIIVPVRAFIIEPFRIPTAAMEPTIPQGSYVLVSKLGYRNIVAFGFNLSRGAPVTSPRRGALVVFEAPKMPGKHFIKRVLALPGDSITFKNKAASINGKPLAASSDGPKTTESLDGLEYQTLTREDRPASDLDEVVPAGQYFMVGDNRDGSDDSRRFGAVPAELLIGEVVYVIRSGRA